MRYITKSEEKNQIPYFQYPKFLLELQLSQNEKLLYMLLYDRARISQKNEWLSFRINKFRYELEMLNTKSNIQGLF